MSENSKSLVILRSFLVAISSVVLATACATNMVFLTPDEQAKAARIAFEARDGYSERELRAIKNHRLFVGMSEHALIESLGVPERSACVPLIEWLSCIELHPDVNGMVENRDDTWGRRSIYTYFLRSSKARRHQGIDSGYTYDPGETRFRPPPFDSKISTVYVYLENHIVVSYAHHAGRPGFPQNYDYEFEGRETIWHSAFTRSDRESFFRFELLKPPPEQAWYVEDSQFNLIDRDGLSYQPGASSPFTGTRSTYYWDGSKASDCSFEMGLRHGPCTIWYDDGSVYKMMTYEIGGLRSEEVFPRYSDQCSGGVAAAYGRDQPPGW